MKNIIAIVLLPLLFAACASPPPRKVVLVPSGDFPPSGTVVEDAVELGFGFRRVTLAVPVNVPFESIGHFGYLYFGKQQLCQVGCCSVSPSGEHAIYQDGPSGNLFLFHPAENELIQLTNHYIGYAYSFLWDADEKNVEVHFDTGWRSKRTYPVP